MSPSTRSAPGTAANASCNTALDPSTPTWPKVLATHDCAFIGKWHPGGHGAPDRQPTAFGFEEFAYFDEGGSPYFKWQAHRNRTKPYFATAPAKFKVGQAGPPTGKEYLTADLNTRAVEFLETRRAKEKPFVPYYCPFAVQWKRQDDGSLLYEAIIPPNTTASLTLPKTSPWGGTDASCVTRELSPGSHRFVVN